MGSFIAGMIVGIIVGDITTVFAMAFVIVGKGD